MRLSFMMLDGQTLGSGLEVAGRPLEHWPHHPRDVARPIPSRRVPFEAVGHEKCHSATALVLKDERFEGVHVGIDKQHPFRNQVAGNPDRALVAAGWTP